MINAAVDTVAGEGSLATLYADRIAAHASAARLDPRQRDAEEVENAVARGLTRLGREVLIAKTVDRFDQGPGDSPYVAHVP